MSDGFPVEIGLPPKDTRVGNFDNPVLRRQETVRGEVAALRQKARSGDGSSLGRNELGLIGWVGFSEDVKQAEMQELQKKYAETLDSESQELFLRLLLSQETFQVVIGDELQKGAGTMCWVLRGEEDAKALAEQAEKFSEWLADREGNRNKIV